MTTPLVLVQAVPGPPDAVYRAFTDPARLASWWWPHLPDATYDLDPVVGGGYRIASAAAGIGVHGTYLVLDAPGRIVQTWVWEDEEQVEETVSVQLTAAGTGTEVTVRHGVADPASTDGLREGWTDCLARLPGSAAITG